MLAISRHYRRWLPQITLLIFCVIITRYFYSEYKFQQKLTATILHRQDLNFDGNMGDCVMSFGVNFFGHNFLVENNYIGMPASRTFYLALFVWHHCHRQAFTVINLKEITACSSFERKLVD